MRITKSLGMAGAIAMVPLVLSMSASPASAMPKSCLTMRVAYEQATLDSTHADAQMTSFEDNVQDYADQDGYYRRKGWYFYFDGHMVTYDLTPDEWFELDAEHIGTAEAYEDIAQTAYSDLVSNCGW